MEISKVKMRILVAFQNRSFLTNSLTRPPTHTQKKPGSENTKQEKCLQKNPQKSKSKRMAELRMLSSHFRAANMGILWEQRQWLGYWEWTAHSPSPAQCNRVRKTLSAWIFPGEGKMALKHPSYAQNCAGTTWDTSFSQACRSVNRTRCNLDV